MRKTLFKGKFPPDLGQKYGFSRGKKKSQKVTFLASYHVPGAFRHGPGAS